MVSAAGIEASQSEVQDRPWLCSKFKASLDYMNPYLEKESICVLKFLLSSVNQIFHIR